MDETRIKRFNLAVIFKTRKDLLLGLEQVAEEILSGATDDIGNDMIGEIERDGTPEAAGYSYHVAEYEYADIYGNPKEGGDDAKTETKS